MSGIEITDELVAYVQRYGPRCRDCADEQGFCPSTGIGCGESDKAVRWVLGALNYGVSHGFISLSATPKDRVEMERALRLALPIIEADHAQAKEMCDADWEGMSHEALVAVRTALSTQSPGVGNREEADGR